jgi:hypothetical protein
LTIRKSSALPDVAFAVCTTLKENEITGVLTGGSAATFYAPDVYQSRDLDFVITIATARCRKQAGAALIGLGYRLAGQTYVHASNPLTVEFPPGPLAIGDDLVVKWNTVKRRSEILHVLTPTDCVRDRLLWFYLQPTDRSSLQAAVGVAQRKDVDLRGIAKWSRRAGFAVRFREFEAAVRSER